ncbi:S-adenosyl-L-methionine-dependent methyltransferases superfamily protein [Euphorbia peplus]|nr:S-adenosyl-L-methionine-dependent methyltransferases superfamily protein [Euphorbia peplus]
MATELKNLNNPPLKILIFIILFSFFYILGFQTNLLNLNSTPPTTQPDFLNCSDYNLSLPLLSFQSHHTLPLPQESLQDRIFFEFCPENYTFFCPCHDPLKEVLFSTERFYHRERHCAGDREKLKCLIPVPDGYRKPFSWPKSRGVAWFKNVPFKKLSEFKKSQNWVRLEGELLVFPGGGTSFKNGVKGYVEEIGKLVPLKSGIRTVLDVGCGVASFGAFLMNYKILTMSIAPRDIHEAQVQFALERGVPAMLGILSTHRLPFPSRSFDMAHCARCLVPWTAYGGLYLMEIDRLLRPGGYWVLSGPPISWKTSYIGWERKAHELEQEQNVLEDLARRLCWKKIAERGAVAVWRKPINQEHCIKKSRTLRSPPFCVSNDADAGWYRKMEACITPIPNVKELNYVPGGPLAKWQKRLNIPPPRIKSEGISVRAYYDENRLWKRRVGYYEKILKPLVQGSYRNVMDMNAGIGGFAAALVKYPVWVMNVVPFDASPNNLSIVYDRGLLGTYTDWCEAFDTYPRTYDLIHAHGVFSMYKDKCDIVDILLEIQRILRPEGGVIIRDHVDIIVKLKGITDRMRWHGRVLHSENGPYHPEKILLIDNSS